MNRVSKAVAFITGAGQGLGKATALRLSASGAKVVICDISEKAATTLADQIGHDKALAVVADVTNEEQIMKSIALAMNKFGKIDINVNCAGIAPPMKVLGKKGPHNLAQFSKVVNINTIGTFNVLRLTAEQMVKNDPDHDGVRGVIINTASIAAMDGQIGQAAYAASKGAVVSMALPIARELASSGIRVMTIAPGLFMTPMMEGLPESVRKDLATTVPLPHRLGNPEEYANLVESIVSNNMLNGEVIRLDGALRMQAK